MSDFTPRLEVLPAPQRQLWPALREVPAHFVLYGGTALALRLAHRYSEDFDFFSAHSFVPERLRRALPFADGGEILQAAANPLTLRTSGRDGVKCSFFGGLGLRQIEPPSRCPDNGVRVASLSDLFAVKLHTLAQRAEARDCLDVDALLRAGLSLATGLAWARLVYGVEFNPMLSLKALTYFEDGDLPSLPDPVKQALVAAACGVHGIPQLHVATTPLGAEG